MTVASIDAVVTRSRTDHVVAVATDDRVILSTTGDGVVAVAAIDHVLTGLADDGVGTVVAVQRVVDVGGAGDGIWSIITVHDNCERRVVEVGRVHTTQIDRVSFRAPLNHDRRYRTDRNGRQGCVGHKRAARGTSLNDDIPGNVT
ncbi:MAG: hypothetical protein CMJ78_07820 [Planctomycetaceae bacterium]|nr:hypothetical protein [Planctomycetaceae bacterium]